MSRQLKLDNFFVVFGTNHDQEVVIFFSFKISVAHSLSKSNRFLISSRSRMKFWKNSFFVHQQSLKRASNLQNIARLRFIILLHSIFFDKTTNDTKTFQSNMIIIHFLSSLGPYSLPICCSLNWNFENFSQKKSLRTKIEFILVFLLISFL